MSHRRGFTLVELMIAVAIIAILASVAVPSYRQYVKSARYQEATSALSETMQRQERWFSSNHEYTTKLSELSGFSSDTPQVSDGDYELEAVKCGSAPKSDCIKLKAKPVSSNDDPTFTYNSRGVRKPEDKWE